MGISVLLVTNRQLIDLKLLKQVVEWFVAAYSKHSYLIRVKVFLVELFQVVLLVRKGFSMFISTLVTNENPVIHDEVRGFVFLAVDTVQVECVFFC